MTSLFNQTLLFLGQAGCLSLMGLKELNHLKVIGRRKNVNVGSVRKLPASTASLPVLNKPFISSLHESGVCLKKPKEASCCTEFLLNLYLCYHPARSVFFFSPAKQNW